jgi:hypothetical protein
MVVKCAGDILTDVNKVHVINIKKNPTGGMDVRCVLSGRGHCDELITHPRGGGSPRWAVESEKIISRLITANKWIKPACLVHVSAF